MFERYTEKARRVIFFARYEASQYGSSFIDTEHILFGLLREDVALIHQFLGHVDLATQIRAEVEKVIKRGERISTSVEMPLSGESKKVLNCAAEEADRLAHRRIGTEHILLGILRLQDSLAARLLIARGAKTDAIREQIARSSRQIPSAQTYNTRTLASLDSFRTAQTDTTKALGFLDTFIGALKGDGFQQPADFFDESGQFVDSSGRRWIGRKEIAKGSETLFAPFAKKNASFLLEDTSNGPSETVVASVLWEFAAVSGDPSKSMLRMSIVLASREEGWAIVLAQVTPLLLDPEHAG